VKIPNKINNFLGLRPYLLFTTLKNTQIKRGSKDINKKRKENLHNASVKNLGAIEKAKDENQRLL
jgi:hypothetical protein